MLTYKILQSLLPLAQESEGKKVLEVTKETASYVLLLPGKILDISALNTAHKFRGRGNKDGAVAARRDLEEAGLGSVIEDKATRGTNKVQQIF